MNGSFINLIYQKESNWRVFLIPVHTRMFFLCDYVMTPLFPKWIMKMKANDILNFPRNSLIRDCGRIKADTWPLNEKIPLSEKRKRNRSWRRRRAEAQLIFLLSTSVSLLQLQWELWTISEHVPCCEHTDRKVGKRLVFIHNISFCFLCTTLL